MPKGQYDRSKAKSRKEPGTNREALQHALAGYSMPRVDTKDPQAIAERINEYLNYCRKNDIAPGVAMCANWLGVSVSTLQSWYDGTRSTPEHQRVAARFYGILQSVWEQDMHEGNINPVSGIFIGKAFYGYKDTQEIVVQHTGTDQLSVADLIAESKRLPGAETMSLTDNASKTIDADYKVIENDRYHERSVARAEKAAERKAAIEDLKPIRKQKKKEYLKEYYKEHKAEQLARNAKSKAKAKAKRNAEQAQNADPDNK